jgi:hypothetical protein
LPVEQITEVELIKNLKTPKALGYRGAGSAACARRRGDRMRRREFTMLLGGAASHSLSTTARISSEMIVTFSISSMHLCNRHKSAGVMILPSTTRGEYGALIPNSRTGGTPGLER